MAKAKPAETTTAAATPAATPAATVEKKLAGPRGPAGISLEAKITLGEQTVKEEGKPDRQVPYGKANNPKREGTKAAARFETYKNGMTVKAALEAGHKPRHIVKDKNKGYIVVAEPAPK